MRRHLVPCAAVLGIALGLSACTDPYDPGQRAVGGGLLGAGAGAAIGSGLPSIAISASPVTHTGVWVTPRL